MNTKNPKLGTKLVPWYYGKKIEIPEEWELSNLGNIGKYVNGFAFKPSDWKKQGIPIIRIQNLTNSSKGFNYFDGKIDSKYEVNNGDILISWSASLGVFIWNGKKAILNQHIFKTIPNSNINKHFFFYATLYQIENMKKMIHGSTMKHITLKPFMKTPIPLPSKNEQEKIGLILLHIDNSIKNSHEIIEQTSRLKKGMMQKLLTKGIGHEKFKKVKWLYRKEIEIPEEWNVEKLKNICTKVTDGTHFTPNYCKNGKLFLSVLNVRSDQIILDKIKYISEEEHTSLIKRAKPEKFDILYTKIGVTYGFAAVVEDISDFSIFVSLALIKPIRKIVDHYFLSNFLNSYLGKKQANMRIKGMAVPDLHLNEIRSFKIFLPSMTEQKQIASILSKIDSKIKKQKLYKVNLELLKKGLMQKLLTGKIRVKF